MKAQMLSVLFMLTGSYWMSRLSKGFLSVKDPWYFRVIPFGLHYLLLTAPLWVGDENAAFLFPVVMGVYMLCYKGPWYTRLVIGAIFYTLTIAIGMMVDSAMQAHVLWLEVVQVGVRVLCYGGIYGVLRRLMPEQKGINMTPKLWRLMAGLTLAPLFAVLSFTLWNARMFDYEAYHQVARKLSFTTLPFAGLSALALLIAIGVLDQYARMKEQQRMAEVQAEYYQGLKREHQEMRALRHDLNNHLTVLQSLAERGDGLEMKQYLRELSSTSALMGGERYCQNEIANALLVNKAGQMEAYGIAFDVEVQLPEKLDLTDVELCALLGNALDNAIEAAALAENKRIHLRVRSDKGMLMMRLENTYQHEPIHTQGRFRTLKREAEVHGFGIRQMEDIAKRHKGAFRAEYAEGRFCLTVSVPLGLVPEK